MYILHAIQKKLFHISTYRYMYMHVMLMLQNAELKKNDRKHKIIKQKISSLKLYFIIIIYKHI